MKKLLERCTAQLQSTASEFPWADRRAYGDWLAQTYHYVRHSTRLLATAAARFAQDERGDALHYRFATHIAEEKKHEQLAIHDLKRLGLALAQFPERHATRMFYEPQYYKIEHQTPAALFGYILPLEAIGPAYGKQVCALVTSAFGERCDAFLRVHANEDEDHIEKALRLIDSVPDREREVLVENLEQTTFAYRALLRDIIEHPSSAV
jgi:thiaminase